MFVGSLFFLFQKKETVLNETDVFRRWRWIIALTLMGPLLAVGMGQLLRGEFYPPNFDAPQGLLCVRLYFCPFRLDGFIEKVKSLFLFYG